MTKQSTDKAKGEWLYEHLLKQVEDILGVKTTTNTELDVLSSKILSKQYKGAYPFDKLPTLEEHEMCILNLDKEGLPGSHWIGVYKNTPYTLIVYDSFGRPIELHTSQPQNVVYQTESDVEQMLVETNCGQRVVSWLIICRYFPHLAKYI